MTAGVEELRYALDRVAFARRVGFEELDECQEKLLRSNASRTLLCCSRQSGKSSITAICALHRALYRPGSTVLIFAPSQDQSKNLFTKIARMFRALGEEMPVDSFRKFGMELPNGSTIEARPGSERTSRGPTADLVVIDEAALVDIELYYALRPTLAVSGGDLMMLSTPKGKRGIFYEAWTSDDPWERYLVTADECPRIPQSFLEEERNSLPERVFLQEYFCVFGDAVDAVFSHDLIEGAFDNEVTPLFGSRDSGDLSAPPPVAPRAAPLAQEPTPLFGSGFGWPS